MIWLLELAEEYADQRGVSKYRRWKLRHTVAAFERHLKLPPTVADLTENNVNTFIAAMMDGTTSRTTIRCHRRDIVTLWNYAARRGLCRKPVYVVTEKIIKRGTEAVHDWRDHVKGTSGDKSLFYCFETVYIPQRLCGSSQSAIHQHEVMLRHFERCLGHTPTLDDLNDATVARLQQWLFDERHQSRQTVNKGIEKLRAQWRHYNRGGLVKTWPSGSKLKEHARHPSAWTPEQLTALFKAAGEVPGRKPHMRMPLAVYFQALIALLVDTGARITEAQSLRPSDCDFTTGCITFRAETTKDGRDATFTLRPAALDLLRSLPTADDRPLLEWPSHVTHFYNWWKVVVELAGMTADRDSGPHKIRRSVATAITKKHGAAIASEFLRHSSIELTRKSYIDPRHLDPRTPIDGVLPDLSAKPSIYRGEGVA